MSLPVFPGVEMLQKPLLKDRLPMERTPLAEGSEFPQLAEQQKVEVVATSPEETHSPGPCLNSCSEGTAHDGFGISGEHAVVEASVKLNDKILNDEIENPTNNVAAHNGEIMNDSLEERNQNVENSLCSTCLTCEEAKEAGQYQITSLGSTISDPEDRTSELNGKLDGNSGIDQKSILECPKGTASVDCQETAEVGIPSDRRESTHDVQVNQSDTVCSSNPQGTASVPDGQKVLFDSEIVNGCHATLRLDNKTSSPSEGDRLNAHAVSAKVSSNCHPLEDVVLGT